MSQRAAVLPPRELLEAASGRPVSRETMALLASYVELLRTASHEQNLVSRSTIESVWERHIADSGQLIRFEPTPGSHWLDIGSGAGLPGIIIAALVQGPVTLVEPRRLRASFLEDAVRQLGLADRVTVLAAKVERITGTFEVITARAVAPLSRLIATAAHLSHPSTIWVLPKGRNAQSELAEAERSWQCDARSEASRTDPDARVLVLSKVRAKR